MGDLDHATLVVRAVTWLRKTEQCWLVLDDAGTKDERADAIGWTKPGESVLVEVKASRADFLRDREKICRRIPERGMGRQRWYFAPQGLIKVEELPAGWGLLEPRERLYLPLKRVAKSAPFPANVAAETHTIFWHAAKAGSKARHSAAHQRQALDEHRRLTAENARMAARIIELQRELEAGFEVEIEGIVKAAANG